MSADTDLLTKENCKKILDKSRAKWEIEFEGRLGVFGLNEEQIIMIILGIRSLLQYQKQEIIGEIEYNVTDNHSKDEAIEIINKFYFR